MRCNKRRKGQSGNHYVRMGLRPTDAVPTPSPVTAGDEVGYERVLAYAAYRVGSYLPPSAGGHLSGEGGTSHASSPEHWPERLIGICKHADAWSRDRKRTDSDLRVLQLSRAGVADHDEPNGFRENESSVRDGSHIGYPPYTLRARVEQQDRELLSAACSSNETVFITKRRKLRATTWHIGHLDFVILQTPDKLLACTRGEQHQDSRSCFSDGVFDHNRSLGAASSDN